MLKYTPDLDPGFAVVLPAAARVAADSTLTARPLTRLPLVPAYARQTQARLLAGLPVTVRRPPLGWRVRQWWKLVRDGSVAVPLLARVGRRLGLAVMYGELHGLVYHADGSVTDYGLLGRRVVTDAGVNFLAGCFPNTNEPEAEKYHGFGTGTTAEAAGQTALVTELTTEYATDNTRPTGSQSASTNTYVTTGTLAPDATVTVTEHGIFSQAANSGGTLWDRTKFTGIALTGSADTLAATYTLTLPSGG